MFDKERLFRVLHHFSVETNNFLVAQDAYESIRSCIHQIKDSDNVKNQLERRLEGLSEKFKNERQEILNCLDKLHEVKSNVDIWCSFLVPLLEEAQQFWFCCPVDHTRCVGENKSPMEMWRNFKDNDNGIPEEILERIKTFKVHCKSLIDSYFPDLLILLKQEIEREKEDQSMLSNKHARFLNSMPLALFPEFNKINQSFINFTCEPRFHYTYVDPHFAALLGFSVPRLLCIPYMETIVNVAEKMALSEQVNNMSGPPDVVKLFYRTATRKVVGVRFDVAPKMKNGYYCGVGIDITQEIETSKLKQTVSIQKMLRQWLHSIRNASFEQQARVILEEVQDLENKLQPHTKEFKNEFESIYECVKLLMHTARTSVGLIDQALDTRGLTQHMCVSDFVSNITSFPHHFAQSEGIPAIYTRYRFLLNGNTANPQDYCSFFVTGDIISLQSIVDNIISNAVRYTDPVLGISVELSLQHQGSRLNFFLDVTDYCPGGLPMTALKFLQDNIGVHKCNDERTNTEVISNKNISKGRSSRTGLPHIVELYHQLTATGGDDFDMNITTRDNGTSFRMRFEMNLMAPASSETPYQKENETQISGTLLVVDDSIVIRKIISRYLHSFQCAHEMCADGAQAWEWFVENHSRCAGVITDLEMPKMGGDALIAKVQELSPGKPCFIVSGNDITSDKLPKGALRAIIKPITADQIQYIISEISLHS